MSFPSSTHPPAAKPAFLGGSCQWRAAGTHKSDSCKGTPTAAGPREWKVSTGRSKQSPLLSQNEGKALPRPDANPRCCRAAQREQVIRGLISHGAGRSSLSRGGSPSKPELGKEQVPSPGDLQPAAPQTLAPGSVKAQTPVCTHTSMCLTHA